MVKENIQIYCFKIIFDLSKNMSTFIKSLIFIVVLIENGKFLNFMLKICFIFKDLVDKLIPMNISQVLNPMNLMQNIT